MLPENKIRYQNAAEARGAGCRVCKCCAPIRAYVEKQRNEIEEYCQQSGISWLINYREGCLMVATYCSDWKIIVNGKEDYIFLYHKNFHNRGVNYKDPVPGYHSQKCRRNNILDYLEYITKHDAYRIGNPGQGKCGERKERHFPKGSHKYCTQQKQKKKEEKKRSIARVLQLIDAIHNEREYRKAAGMI